MENSAIVCTFIFFLKASQEDIHLNEARACTIPFFIIEIKLGGKFIHKYELFAGYEEFYFRIPTRELGGQGEICVSTLKVSMTLLKNVRIHRSITSEVEGNV